LSLVIESAAIKVKFTILDKSLLCLALSLLRKSSTGRPRLVTAEVTDSTLIQPKRHVAK
jgi:hypothetical protein